MIKTLNKLGIEVNIIMAIYDRPTAYIVLNGENLKVFPLRSGTRQRWPIQHTSGSLRAIWHEIQKEIKGIQIEKKEIKWAPVCKGHDLICRKL